MKTCTKCKEEKPLTEFHKDKRKKDGLRSQCKACEKAYYEANKDKIIAQQKAYRQANKDRIKAKNKAYREANKDKILAKVVAYNKKKYHEDPMFKLKNNIRLRVRRFLKGSKSESTQKIIGCSWEQVFLKLNYERFENPSHDHIIPLSWSETEEELYALFRWENMQGMESSDNTSKGDRYCSRQLADNVAKVHPKPEVIKQILSRQNKKNDRYYKAETLPKENRCNRVLPN